MSNRHPQQPKTEPAVVKRPRYSAIALGDLPVATINAALGTELEPGPARLSEAAHRHMAEDHPLDYPDCIAVLPQAVTAPTFIGQAPRHGRNFEMVKRIVRPDGKAVLVAIGLEPDDAGAYRVKSCYLISGNTVEARRQARTLKPAVPK